MLPDRVSNPGPLTYESGALPIELRGPAICRGDNPLAKGLKLLDYLLVQADKPWYNYYISYTVLSYRVGMFSILKTTKGNDSVKDVGRDTMLVLCLMMLKFVPNFVKISSTVLTLMHSERPKVYTILALLKAIKL